MNTATQSAPTKILVVDDLYANLVAMRRVLAGLNLDVHEAGSGNAALAACLEHEFALILLDVQMPDMDGMEVAEILRSADETRDISIIFVSAGATEDVHHLQGYDLGAVDYVTKPINAPLLSAKVHNFVELYESRMALQRTMRELARVNERLKGEIEERRKAEERAQHLATHDALTGLPNRLLFTERLATNMGYYAENHTQIFAVAYMDLDGFKPVNDQHGHRAGDVVLEEIALRLRANTRDTDTVARFGGDEFALIFENISDAAGVSKRCQLLRRVISQPIEVPTGDTTAVVSVDASIGISIYPRDGQTPDALMHTADLALYGVKNSGKADVRVYAGLDRSGQDQTSEHRSTPNTPETAGSPAGQAGH